MRLATLPLRSGDFWSGLALAALGATIVHQALGWEYLTPDGPGPGFFPRWYGIAMIVLSLALVVRSVRSSFVDSTMDTTPIWRALICWTALVTCIVLTKAIGFYASFALLCWTVAALLFRVRQHVAIMLAVAAALGFWLVFGVALDVALPRAAWGS